MIKKTSFRLGFVISAILFLGISVFLTAALDELRGARVDLTEDQLFTLSPSAKSILATLKVPVQVKYYVTAGDKMPTELKYLERDVRDKLRDYSAASGGMLQFSVHDPFGDEEQEQALMARGIRPFQVRTVDRDEVGLKMIWSAISIAYKDKPEEILPQVLPQSLMTFEYELLSRVYRMTREKEPLVAVFAQKPTLDPEMMSAYLQMGMEIPELPDTWEPMIEILREEHFDVHRIELSADSPVPEDADALLVLSPRNLNERQSWEIANALSRGVNTLVAIQNHEYDYQPGQRGGFRIGARETHSGLDALLASFGVQVDRRQLFDMEQETLNIPRTANLGGMRFQTSEPVRAPMQISVRGEQMNRDLSITNRIEQLFYLWGTDVSLDGVKLEALDIESSTLFTSSGKAWRKDFSSEPLTQLDIDPAGKHFESELPLAWLLEGNFPSPEGGVPAWPGLADSLQSGPGVNSPEASAKLMVTGCAKMFEKPFVGAGQNVMLLLNSVDALALGGELIGIRSRLITQRSIRPTEAGEKLFYRIFSVLLVPVLIAVYGIVRMVLRRKESALHEESLSAGRL